MTATNQPSIAQMKVRSNDFHARILRALAGNQSAKAGSTLDVKALSRARGTLFRWGCLANGPMQRNEKLWTSYPLRFTWRGIDLLTAIDPIAGAFARVIKAEHELADYRALAISLDSITPAGRAVLGAKP